MNKTIKSAVALGLSAIATITSAHSMLPSEIKEYVTRPTNKFNVELVNRYPSSMCYGIEENGKPSLLADVCLAAGESRKIVFWVNSEPDKQTNHTICTSPRMKGNVKVRLCSVVKTYYPYSRLLR